MSAVEFLSPLFLLLAVPALVAFWLGRRNRGALVFAPSVLFADRPLPTGWRARASALPAALELAAVLLFVVALGRPAERVELPAERLGVDILLVLDVSSSMQQQDLAGDRSRLAVATAAARRFVEARTDDRIGLVSFAAYPRLVCPPTLDHAALGAFLDALEPVAEDGPEDRTALGAAAAHAGRLLGDDDGTSRVVVLLTDGEENVARSDAPDEVGPARARALCAALGVRVYGVQLGERGRGAGARPIDTLPMQQLCEATGGTFERARDAAGVEAVFAEIDRLERARFAEPRSELRERFLAFLIAGVACFALAIVLAQPLEAVP